MTELSPTPLMWICPLAAGVLGAVVADEERLPVPSRRVERHAARRRGR